MTIDAQSWSDPADASLPLVVGGSMSAAGPASDCPATEPTNDAGATGEDKSAEMASHVEAQSPPLVRSETLIDSVVMLLIMSVVQRSVGFVRGILVCRWLSPAELGQWDLAYGFLNLAVPVAVLGIPGSFGRYMERYRMRGQGRRFLALTGSVIALLAGAGFTVMLVWPEYISEFVFGHPNATKEVVWLAFGLVSLIGFTSLTELFSGLRQFRVVSLLEFGKSLVYAILSIVLLVAWETTSDAIIVAYTVSAAVCLLAFLVPLRTTWRELPRGEERLVQSELWRTLLPFAVWVWVTNWLVNLFEITDRYMILHFSGMPNEEALAQVGNYHSARIVPLLLLAIAGLISSAALPHLSYDWEAGRREQVSRRVNLVAKMMGLTMVVTGTAIMIAAPLLFEVAFAGKFHGGASVLPLTLTYLCWAALATVLSNYLWCAEKASWGSLALLLGLIVNMALNLTLLPILGLMGAVIATTAAHAVALILIAWCGRILGLKLSLGMVAMLAAPLVLALGPIAGCVFLAFALHQAWRGQWLFDELEKSQIKDFAQQQRQRLLGFLGH